MNVRTTSVAIAALVLSLTMLSGCHRPRLLRYGTARRGAARRPVRAGRPGWPTDHRQELRRPLSRRSISATASARMSARPTLQALMQGYRHCFARRPPPRRSSRRSSSPSIPSATRRRCSRSYVAAFGTPLVGLTGSADAIAAAAKAYGDLLPEAGGAGGCQRLSDGSQQPVILFGSRGPADRVDPHRSEGAKAVADTLAQWVH